MKKVVKFLSYFPQVPGRVWVDAYSLIALIKFAMGRPVDVGTLGLILGVYAGSKVASKLASKGNPDVE